MVQRGAPIPEGASLGFVKARALTSGKKKASAKMMGIESDSDDLAIEIGPSFSSAKRSVSDTGVKGRAKGKDREFDEPRPFKRSKTLDNPFVGKKPVAACPSAKRRTTVLSEDDDDEHEIVIVDDSSPPRPNGKGKAREKGSIPPAPAPISAVRSSPSWPGSPNSDAVFESSVMGIPYPSGKSPSPTLGSVSLPPEIAAQAGFDKVDKSWLLEEDFEEECAASLVESSSEPALPNGKQRMGPPASIPQPTFKPPLKSASTSKTAATSYLSNSVKKQPPPSNSRKPFPVPSSSPNENEIRSIRTKPPQPPRAPYNGLAESWVLADDDGDDEEDSIPASIAPTPDNRSRSMLPPTSTRPLSSPYVGSPFESTQAIRRLGGRPRLRATVVSSSPAAPTPSRPQQSPDESSPLVQLNHKKARRPPPKGPSWYKGVVPEEMKQFYDRNAGDDRDNDDIMSDDGSAIMDEETEEDR